MGFCWQFFSLLLPGFFLTAQCKLCPTCYVCVQLYKCVYWIEHRLLEKEKVKVPFEWAKLTKNKRRDRCFCYCCCLLMTTTMSATTTRARETRQQKKNEQHHKTVHMKYHYIILHKHTHTYTQEVYSMAAVQMKWRKTEFNSSGSSNTYDDMIENSKPYTKKWVHEISTKAMATVITTLMMALTETKKLNKIETITEYTCLWYTINMFASWNPYSSDSLAHSLVCVQRNKLQIIHFSLQFYK